MAHDEELAERLRHCLGGIEFVEKRMFGGLAFLVGGHMALAANSQGEMMVRVDPRHVETLLARAGVRRTEMNGRELKGWLDVDAAGLTSDDLAEWVDLGVTFVGTLPAK